MLGLAWINREIFRPGILAHDHSNIDLFLWADEQSSTLLNIIKCISCAYPCFHGNHDASVTPFDLAFKRCVLAKEMTHHSFAPGQIYQIGFESDQAARRNDRFNGNTIRVMIHADNFALSASERLYDVTDIFIWDLDIQILDRLQQFALSIPMKNNFRS